MSEPPRPVCVLSTGRAGTSLLTRVVNFLGVDLGAEEGMLEAEPNNERGYWENRSIMELNDEILTSLGGRLFAPPLLSRGWDRTPAVAGARDAIRTLVEQTFDRDRRWGFKDPRTVLTLPLWRDVIGPMDYIICVRREEEVTESLRRGGVVMDDFGQWWLDLNVLALEQTLGERRLVVCYEDWFVDPRRVVERLALFLTGESDVADDVWEQVTEFFEPSLRRVDLRTPGAIEPATTEVDALYELLRLAAHRDEEPAERPLQLVLAQWLASSHRSRRALAERASEAEDLRAERAALHGRCDELSQELAEAHRDLADAHRDLVDARHHLHAAHVELDVFATSRSWRITAPMRSAAERARILRRTR